MNPRILDGPMGSELSRRGVDTTSALWSAVALRDAPELVRAVHADHAAAGAEIHRTNTFRARRRTAGDAWESMARDAVRLAREGVERGAPDRRCLVLGSVGPLEDCYRPELAPPDDEARPEHEELATLLAACGVDGLIGETFPSPREALVATRACVRTGLPTWMSFTAGPSAEGMTPGAMKDAARACLDAGAERVLVNCVAAALVMPYVEALASLGAPFGVYANASRWHEPPVSPEEYAAHARRWADAGAGVIGSCCGTGLAHVRALALTSGATPPAGAPR